MWATKTTSAAGGGEPRCDRCRHGRLVVTSRRSLAVFRQRRCRPVTSYRTVCREVMADRTLSPKPSMVSRRSPPSVTGQWRRGPAPRPPLSGCVGARR
ncbi:hypothetical protein ABB07_38450 [Streptomyces incarnatus]|uniref:Uncharacterized protein n=1 Tax=Streptomyces incarnatus TaxID=665007 RepID=A0ABN4GVC2_9ACTN|nr:hypothetical protein ABB07_38450 [Streptomyces incarnatus]